MDDQPQPTKKQALLHVGSRVRDDLERIGKASGERWQDLARSILKSYVDDWQDETKSYGWDTSTND
jgi:hypothetical protein